MKIGLVYFTYPLYAGGSHITDFVNSLAKLSDRVVLISTHYPKVEIEKPQNLKIVWIPDFSNPILNNLSFIVFSFFYMVFSKDFREVDLINVICARGIFSSYLFSKIFRKPLICTVEIINNPETSRADRIFYHVQRFLYSKLNFSKVICWSVYHYKKYLQKWGLEEKDVAFIPNGINLEQYNPSVDGSEIKTLYGKGSHLIVFAKPLYAYNKISAIFLIETLKYIKHDVRLLLGRGEFLEEVERYTKSMGAEDKVSFMPFVPMTEIPKYLAASDLIVLPFLYEATVSRSLLEALAMGKPIITTDLGEPAMILNNNENALVVNPDKEEVAKAIDYLLDHPGIRESLGEGAKRLSMEYTIKATVTKTVQLYKTFT